MFCIVCVCAGVPLNLDAQTSARVAVQENFRREPNGVILASLATGTEMRVVGRDGNWTQVALSGWIWLPSVQASDEAAFELVVAEAEGENLRVEPAGPVLGRLEEGALLTEIERNSSWAHVTRTGWVWTASLDVGDASSDPTGATAATPPPALPAARSPGGFASVGESGGAILTAPDGDTLARASGGSDIEVLDREGNWVRVRLEGWMWRPATREGSTNVDEPPEALEPADLASDPVAHVGRVVAWSVQFISLERAEAVRTDFFEGEPFLLARFDGADGPFVYIAVPAERIVDVEGLVPLERVSVTARVRTGASSLTSVPIVDLLSIVRSREVP